MSFKIESIQGMRVTVMGLGLHGGGIEAALFFARNGAKVTVTDLKDETALSPSIERLAPYPIRYTLGRHEPSDFIDTDLVIKNPGVPPGSQHLAIARSYGIPIETDISIFFALTANPVIAVTGSKGKSTVASAIHFCLKEEYPDARIGGNITVSPFSFLNIIGQDAPVVLELSSWQLADLRLNERFKPKVSVITNLLPDHMNWYSELDGYLEDKKIIYKNQDKGDFSIFNLDDPRLAPLCEDSAASVYCFSGKKLPDGIKGAYLENGEGILLTGVMPERIFGEHVRLKGFHNRLNLITAGLACSLFGEDTESIRMSLPEFPGIEHRFELFMEKRGISFYNDSAATIPHSTKAALLSLKGPVSLITGGTDKNIDFGPLMEVSGIPERIYLLSGSATSKIISGLEEKGIRYYGPYDSLETCLTRLLEDVKRGDIVLFSPGCASFGMFENEFDRGRKFKACVKEMMEK